MKALSLSDDDRAALVALVSLLRHTKKATLTTTEAGEVMGVKKHKMHELLHAGVIAGFKVPSSRKRQRLLPAVAGKASDAEPSRDPRHHRIPALCVLLTVAREWLGGLTARGIELSTEDALQVIGPLIRHLTLPMLRQLRDLIDARVRDREEALRTIERGLPKKGPRSKGAQESTPELPLA